jgi:prepilin peptidase CpaA
MATTWTTAAWFLPFVIPIAIWVTWSDMSSMKIPNKAVLALMVVFAVVGLIALPFMEYLWRWSHFVVVIIITFVLNALRMLGAGDAKFAAAMAPFIALPDWYPFMFLLFATLIAAFIIHRVSKATRIRQMVPDWESWTRREFPMGMALAPALVFYLLIAIAQG